MVGKSVSVREVGRRTKGYQWIDALCWAYHDESFQDVGIHLVDEVLWASLCAVIQHINIKIYRNFELTGLQAGNIVHGCEGPAPYFLPYFTVRLENRKGWQNKLGHDGPLESKWEKDQGSGVMVTNDLGACQATPITFISKKFRNSTCTLTCWSGFLSSKAALVAN